MEQTQGKKGLVPGWLKVVLAVVLTLAVTVGGFCLLMGREGLSIIQGWMLVRTQFVDPQVDLGQVADQALNGMVEGLGDRWSYYLDAQRYDQVMNDRSNHYVGVGITVTYEREEGLLVVEVAQDGPAHQAGVRPGDVVVAVDGVSIAGEARYDGADRIAGEEGTQVTLTLLGEDGTQRDAVCTRATLVTQPAQGKLLEDGVGYVLLSNFYAGAADSFREQVDALVEQGATGLIIDLRNDPGGYVSELTAILDYLLPEGVVFRHNPRWERGEEYRSDAQCIQLPMVTLVNENTYSAAELLAAELREFQGTPVVGTRTSGKGYSQITFPLLNGGGMGLSTATYTTGEGHSLIGEGIVPDVELELAEGEDNQLQAAIDCLKQP